jgi:hypothetical protein
MSLDDFKSSGKLDNSKKKSKDVNEEKQKDKNDNGKKSKDDEPFKVVRTNSGLEKVFPKREDWEETLDIIENEMNYTVNSVMNMESNKRHDVLHNAILKRNNSEGGEYSPTKQCILCGEKFVFPSKWNFVKFRKEAVCKSHEVKKVMAAISEINSTDIN